MRLVFIHDGPIYHKDGKYYEYSYHGLYERYSYLADEIIFLMRVNELPSEERYDLISEQVHIVSFPNFKAPSLYLKNRIKAEKIIKEEVRKANMLILRDSSAASIAVKYANQFNVPYIRECVGCSWDSLWNYSLLGKILALPAFLRQKREIKRSPYVYYVTNKFLQRRYPTSGKQIGCSDVVVNTLNEDILRERIRKINDFDKEKEISLGTAAAIDVRYKGQEYVITAIALLKEKGYKIKYYLAGGNRTKSSYLKECAQKYRVSDNVIFCGSLSKSEMASFYDNIDIYIQPSKLEGMPRSVIEAMSHGCPVLGSNVGGIPELIDQECLFQKENITQIAKAIVNIINQDMSKYAKCNFEKAKKYTSDQLDRIRKDFYDQFLAEYFNKDCSE